MRRKSGVAALVALFLSTLAAQDRFEVASVKPSDPYKNPIVAWNTYPGGRIVITDYNLDMLIEVAYGMSLYRITGLPEWGRSDYFDITAKAPAGSPAAAFVPSKPKVIPPPEHRAMIRTLLADRFGLKLHRETRELRVYGLVIARGGPRLQPAADPSADSAFTLSDGEIKAKNRDVTWLAAILERRFNQTILDHTGLTGTYDIQFKFDPNALLDSADPSPDPTRPLFNTALETQLGLKLTAGKSPVEVLVIDEARKPTAN